MDRSLWLLLRLKLDARLRRGTRSFRTLKGLLLAVVGSLVFVPSIVGVLVMPRFQSAAQLSTARLYGPLLLFLYCILNVLFSSGDRSVYYSPAEVNFLFSGPYRSRQLLIYKMVGGIGAAFLTAIFMSLGLRQHAAMSIAAFLGLFLGLELLYLFSLAVGLCIATLGALAFNRGRRLVLFVVVALAASALWSIGTEVASIPPLAILQRAISSPTLTLVVMPFRPFVMAFTSERFWPDLLGWSALSLLIDGALAGLVLVLNAEFLEASASASERIYSKMKKLRTGAGWAYPISVRYDLPMFPWGGGIGPNFWRQLTTLSRTPTQLLGLGLLFLSPVLVAVLISRESSQPMGVAGPTLTFCASILLLAPGMVRNDFRSDVTRMEDLKTLPIRASRMVVGQISTPLLILTLASWFTLGCLAVVIRSEYGMIATLAILVLPLNLILLLIENLYFLWFPFRPIPSNSIDIQAIGRQILLLIAKVLSLSVAATFAGAAGAFVYLVLGRNWTATVATVWVVGMGCGIGLIPPVASAFENFDVSDTPPE